MRTMLAVMMLGLVALPARAGEPPSGCAWLCGNWTLDATRSESAESAVDAALQKYRFPKPRNPPRPRPMDPMDLDGVDGPPPAPASEPPGKAALRAQLLSELAPPASLAVRQQSEALLIRVGDGEEQRLYPGEPHSRIDAQGTTEITTDWRKDALVVREIHDRRHVTAETFSLLADGNLQLTRVLERQGLKALRLRAIYRRSQPQALESRAPERPQDGAPGGV